MGTQKKNHGQTAKNKSAIKPHSNKGKKNYPSRKKLPSHSKIAHTNRTLKDSIQERANIPLLIWIYLDFGKTTILFCNFSNFYLAVSKILSIFAIEIKKQQNMNNGKVAYNRLIECDIRPSVQRIAIMDYLLTHPIHPTIDDVYQELYKTIPTLSKTTVYNTLRMMSEKNAAQMITIDEHRVCYDGNTTPHVHFFCKKCGKVIDLFDEKAPKTTRRKVIEGNIVDEQQLYYKGICADCVKLNKEKKLKAK